MRALPAAASAALAAALLAGCGQPFLSAQVEIPELRIAEPPQTFPVAAIDPSAACSYLSALEPALAPSTACSGVTAAFDLGAEVPLLTEKGVTTDVRLKDVALHLAAGGPSDLRGVTRVEVGLKDAAGDYAKVASYLRPAGAAPTRIDVSATSSLELSRFLSGGRLDARVEVEMDPAYLPSGFSASIDAGFSVVVTLHYGDFL